MKKPILIAAIVIVLALAGLVLYGKTKSSSSDTPTNGNGSTENTGDNTPPPAPPATTPPAATTTPPAGNDQTAAKTINIKNNIFAPPQITVKVGDTVTWTNSDNIAHTITADTDKVNGPDSGNIAAGQSYSFTFRKAGSFQYHCEIHHSMRGTIVVQ